ncbi:NAD(P)H-hydrate dehydratase [Candidatus Collierbacteria bacterium]|nr:NAD(P)H-hydrate dehydratase [Candidatus Collierbacteria bacterium]
MQVERFDQNWLSDLWQPKSEATKFEGGQVTIVSGSELFHGPAIWVLKTASRIVDMVYFAGNPVNHGVVDLIKSSVGSFIFVPRDDMFGYMDKSEAILVGPGMMRNHRETDGSACDEVGKETREITLKILNRYQGKKKILLDGGSLQVLSGEELPAGVLITPNKKEYQMLFGESLAEDSSKRIKQAYQQAQRRGITLVIKDETAYVVNSERVVEIKGGNAGLTKGGSGDIMAGVAVGLLAKNETVLAVAAAVWLTKRAAENLACSQGLMFSADDLADEVTKVYGQVINKP